MTRAKVIALCRANGIRVREKNFSLVEAYGADEAFLTGTLGAQTRVAEIDGKAIGDGTMPVTETIRGLYKDPLPLQLRCNVGDMNRSMEEVRPGHK